VIANDKPGLETDGDIEALWLAEAERRLEELRTGQVQGIPAEDVFHNAREALKPGLTVPAWFV
jgi:hypothetical protein